MKTFVYIDGFNLYYGCLKGTPHRWLNPAELCRFMLPGHDIAALHYFTARISGRPSDPQAPNRQQIYLRALRTVPNLQITLGFFLAHDVLMPRADPKGAGKMALVIRTDEKGSDVNLASHLLMDAFDDRFECAVLITNDSDLAFPVRCVRQRFGKQVGILNPQKRPSRTLASCSDFFKQIRAGVLARSLFPDTLRDRHGEFHKPAGW